MLFGIRVFITSAVDGCTSVICQLECSISGLIADTEDISVANSGSVFSFFIVSVA